MVVREHGDSSRGNADDVVMAEVDAGEVVR